MATLYWSCRIPCISVPISASKADNASGKRAASVCHEACAENLSLGSHPRAALLKLYCSLWSISPYCLLTGYRLRAICRHASNVNCWAKTETAAAISNIRKNNRFIFSFFIFFHCENHNVSLHVKKHWNLHKKPKLHTFKICAAKIQKVRCHLVFVDIFYESPVRQKKSYLCAVKSIVRHDADNRMTIIVLTINPSL